MRENTAETLWTEYNKQTFTNPQMGDSIIRGTFSTWHVEKQNILESLKFLYKYFIRVLGVQKK